MAKFGADITGDFQMIVDNQANVGVVRYGQNRFGHAADFVGRRFFGAELDQIRAAVAKLLRHHLGGAALQTGRVHERIKPAISERFHRDNLIYLTGEHRGNGV